MEIWKIWKIWEILEIWKNCSIRREAEYEKDSSL
jgi:hypothetical protein